MPAPSNARTLSELKDQLYKTFNRAMDDHEAYYSSNGNEERGKAAKRANEAAEAIMKVEHHIATQDFLKALREEGGSIAFETGPDGSTKISVLNPIRLKPAGGQP
jgi:hypothetical protein